MKEYVKKQGVIEMDQYRLYELTITSVMNGQTVMDFTEASKLLEVGDVDAPVESLERSTE